MSRLRSLVREPLVHFLALGALMFLLGRGTDDRAGPEGSRIVVTQGHIDQLIAGFTMTWQRPPTQAEVQGLIDDYVREEVYYRESLALGLDRDDIIIRRRLRQKMEFLSQDLADAVTPTDAELQSYLDEHAEAYRVEPVVSLAQRYLGADPDIDEARHAAVTLLGTLDDLSSPSMPDAAGVRSLLPERLADTPLREVARLFGQRFADQLSDIPVGRWTGPVESGYGVHLVYVDRYVAGRTPRLDEVRPLVLRDWASDRRDRVNDQVFEELLQRYTVVVEPGEVAETSPGEGRP